MTKFQGEARVIDNSRLMGLRTGNLYITPLGYSVPWEGYGERALLILNERRRGLRGIVSQPGPVMSVPVGGKRVRYTPDFRFTFQLEYPNGAGGELCDEIWEAKSASQLTLPKWQEKLSVVETALAAQGKRFRVLNGTEAAWSIELRTAEVLRLYRLVPVTDEVERWLQQVVRDGPIVMGEFAEMAQSVGLGRQHIYSAIYRRILAVDESLRLNDQREVGLGEGRAWQDTGSTPR